MHKGKKVLWILVFSLLTFACREDTQELKEHDRFSLAQAYFDASKYPQAIEILSDLQNAKSLDGLMVTDYLAQSYASLSGLNMLELFLEMKEISHSKNAVELTQMKVGEWFKKLPPANHSQLEHMRKAVEVYDHLGGKRPDHAVVYNHRLLYRSLYLLYLSKSLFIDVKSLVESKTIGDQLEYLVELNRKGALILSEKIMFEMVAMVPNLTEKVKKLADKLLKNGYFVFRFKGQKFILDFRERTSGGVAKLLTDIFRLVLANLASRLDMDVSTLTRDFLEIEGVLLDIIYGKTSVNEAIINLSKSNKAQTLILEALKHDQGIDFSKRTLQESLKDMSWQGVLTQDVDSLIDHANQNVADVQDQSVPNGSLETIKKIDPSLKDQQDLPEDGFNPNVDRSEVPKVPKIDNESVSIPMVPSEIDQIEKKIKEEI